MSVPTNGTYKVGDTLSFTVNTGEAVSVTGTLGYQACNEQQCFMPEEVPVEAKLAIR